MQDVLASLVVDIDFMENMKAKFYLNPLKFLILASFSGECTIKITK